MLTTTDLRGAPDLAAAVADLNTSADGSVDETVTDSVAEIIADVRRRGDDALRDLAERFDGAAPAELSVPKSRWEAAFNGLDADLADALVLARDNIAAYHETQLSTPAAHRRAGVRVRELIRPVERAGCYVPGGRAAYPSTLLMTAVPARVAGVSDVAVCVPAGPTGQVADVVLAAAHVAGVDRLHPVGGAQAIAALAYGTDSVAPVDVIVGPGNVYVAVAQQMVRGHVGVPAAFAGPSEILVIADDTVDPDLVALDLIVQAEHGPGGQAWLVCWQPEVAAAVSDAVARLASESPRQADIAATMAAGGRAVIVDDSAAAVAVANAMAPEHLELLVADPEGLLDLVSAAGAVFCGAPAALGDYAAGPNHVLPTAGTARFAEALRVDDFVRRIHVVDLEDGALAAIGPAVIALATAEGLPAHADAVARRMR